MVRTTVRRAINLMKDIRYSKHCTRHIHKTDTSSTKTSYGTVGFINLISDITEEKKNQKNIIKVTIIFEYILYT